MISDLENRLRRFAPDLRPPVLPDGDVSYTVAETPVGPLTLAVSDGRLVACSYAAAEEVAERLAKAISPRVLRVPAHLDLARRQLDEYFAGRRRAFDVPVDLRLASPFGRRVLAALRDVPYGETTTYVALATAVGAPRASRAVGGALGANPVCVIVPCHRVVRTDGSVGGYAGGPAAKERLLGLEGRRPSH